MVPVAGSTCAFAPLGVFDSLKVTEKLTCDASPEIALKRAVKLRVWFLARLPKSHTRGELAVAAHLSASPPIAPAKVRPPVGAWSVTTTWVRVWLAMFLT